MGEGGAVYFDESGVLCFEDRRHLQNTTSVVTIDQDNAVEDIVDEVDDGALINRVRVRSSVLKEAGGDCLEPAARDLSHPDGGCDN